MGDEQQTVELTDLLVPEDALARVRASLMEKDDDEPPTLPDNAPDETVTAFCDHAAVAAEAVAEFATVGINLDYSTASAASLDVLLSDRFGPSGLAPDDPAWKPEELHRRLIALVGSYVGEVVRARVGGSWVDDPEHPGKPLFVRLDLGKFGVVWPLERAYRRLKHGSRESLFTYVEVIDRKVGRAVDPNDDAMGWTAQASDFVRRDRVDVAQRFLDRALELSPRLSEAWFTRGVVLEKAGHLADARYAYERALAFDSTEDDRVRSHLEQKIDRLSGRLSGSHAAQAAAAAADPWGTGAYPAHTMAPMAGLVSPTPSDSRAVLGGGASSHSGGISVPPELRLRQSDSRQALDSVDPSPAPAQPAEATKADADADAPDSLVLADDLEFDSDISAAFDAAATPLPVVAVGEPSTSSPPPLSLQPAADFVADAEDGIALAQDAQQLAALGRFEEAVVCYTQAVQIAPTLVEARIGLAIACLCMLRPEDAIDALAPIASERHPEAIGLHARALCALRRADEAVALLEVAADDPRCPSEFLLERGQALLALGNWSDATAVLALAVQERVDHPDAWLGLAIAAGRSGDERRARLAYTAYVGLQHAATYTGTRFALSELDALLK